MEENLLKIFRLADLLNEKQNKIYAQIKYTADNNKTLEISIRSKNDFSYIERCEVCLNNKSLIKWNDIIKLFEHYVGGVCNE